MFLPIPSQPMDAKEEFTILTVTGCPQELVNILLIFANKYRQSMSTDNVLKNRKLRTWSLVRIAWRLALNTNETDLQAIIQRSVLAEFLPAMEKMNLNTLLEDSNIFKKTAPVCSNSLLSRLNLIVMFPCSITPVHFYKIIPSFSQHQAALEEGHTWLWYPFSTLLTIRKALHLMCHIWTISIIIARNWAYVRHCHRHWSSWWTYRFVGQSGMF